jgi:hypothetical protein
MTPMKKFPWAIYFILLFVILAIALAPVGSVIVASVIANAYGCHVDEGSAHPCIIGGQDYGETLYTLGVMGWLMLLTLPTGVVAALFWLVVLLLHRSRWKKRQGAATPAENA